MVKLHRVAIALLVVAGFVACGRESEERATMNRNATGQTRDGRAVRLAYVLQADALAADRASAVALLAASDRTLFVLDRAFVPGQRWQRRELDAIRAGGADRRILAYHSIGEAERYRAYWRQAWDADADGQPDAAAPDWLLSENPHWPGNYRVRFWDPAWQDLILADLPAIAASGFDGLFLDIVDAYLAFEVDGERHIDDRRNPATGRSYRQDMIAWVQRLAARARALDLALIVPQNATPLLHDAGYRAVIDGVGLEDTFSDDDRPQSDTHRRRILADLRLLEDRHWRWTVEYAARDALRRQIRRQAQEAGLPLLETDRALDRLGTAQRGEGGQHGDSR